MSLENEERELRDAWAQHHKWYMEATAPILKRLADIEALKPINPVMIMSQYRLAQQTPDPLMEVLIDAIGGGTGMLRIEHIDPDAIKPAQAVQDDARDADDAARTSYALPASRTAGRARYAGLLVRA